MSSIGDSREVGWFSWMEWSHVRQLLYSFNDTKSQVKGINMVNVWRSRLNRRSLPVAVELTAALVAAYVGNLNCVCGNEYQAQMSSAMAIVRFVNGITDQHQTGIYAQSVQLIADKINIPDWMVDLRHEATHAELPGIDILKSGLVIALDWLNDSYWEETANKLIEKEQTLLLNLNQQIGDYVDLVLDIMTFENKSKNNHRGMKENKRNKQKKIDRLLEISNTLRKYFHIGNLNTFISTLVQDGFFILNVHQTKLLGLTVNSEYDVLPSSTETLLELASLWKVLLDTFQENFPMFIELLTTEIIKGAKRNKTPNYHINYLLSMFILSKCHKSSDVTLSNYLLYNPSHLGFQVLRTIIEEGSCTPALKNKVCLFLDIFKPVIYVLNSPSTTYDSTKLDNMVTEAAQNGREIINKLKNCLGVISEFNHNPKVELLKSWSNLSEKDISLLPPMGEFSSNDKLFNLDVDNSMKDVSVMEKEVSDNTVSYMGINNTINENDNLRHVIDNLFMDNTIYVGDNDVSSASTDEYQLDDETVWDEDVDFNIDDKDAVKQGFDSNFFLYQPKNLRDCDASKILFF